MQIGSENTRRRPMRMPPSYSEQVMLYRNLSGYLREAYGARLRKLCIDGGFTCPNRDGTCGRGGCIFCGERGAGEHIAAHRSIAAQVDAFFRNPPKADGYIAYFQNFTNTYAPCSVLRARYDAALTDQRIKVLSVGTRPDCISEENAALLASYRERVDVWAELGLQTANDRTAEIIHRGYRTKAFTSAVELLHCYGISVVVHIMIGLPNETAEDVLRTVAYLNTLPLWGIKIHSTYVMRGTVLEQMYLDGRYQPISMQEYAETAAAVLAHIPPQMVVHRLTGDCPAGLLAAPAWSLQKHDVLAAVTDAMRKRQWKQGCLYRSGEEKNI